MNNLESRGQKLRPSIRSKLRQPRALPFYQSPAWRFLIASIKAVRGSRCEDPDHEPGTPRGGVRIYGDHIKELKDGGAALEANNIMLRCGACHNRKTAKVRSERFK